MQTFHRSRTAISVFVAVLTVALTAPIAVHAEEQIIVVEDQVVAVDDQIPVLAPVAAPSWDETSGYGSVEASRAATSALLAPVAGPSWDESSGYASVERTRAEVSTSLSGELISGVEQALARSAAAAALWDETSGYGSLEASRAAIGHDAGVSRSTVNALPAAPATPILTDLSAMSQTARLFTVTGTDFTAGGPVYLAIYDRKGAQLYETRWITASSPVPVVAALTGHEGAFVRGGTFLEMFADLCGASAMMRAYDQTTATWSNWLTVEPSCAGGDGLNSMG